MSCLIRYFLFFPCRDEVRILTYADQKLYEYFQKYRPELLAFASTPRDIEAEVMKENPEAFPDAPPSLNSQQSVSNQLPIQRSSQALSQPLSQPQLEITPRSSQINEGSPVVRAEPETDSSADLE